jgi:hypothetical protein
MSTRLVYNHIPRLTLEMETKAGILVHTTALLVEQRSKASMSGPKSGRIYRRGKKSHQASAPGEPPAVDTGKLKNSIHTTMVTTTKAQVIANTDYAERLEKRMKRQFFSPVLDQLRDWFVTEMEKVIGGVK